MAALGGAAGAGLIVAAFRVLWPLLSRALASVLSVRKELDGDRDRIIDNLRDEVADLNRRWDACKERLDQAEAEAAEAKRDAAATRQRVGELERLIRDAIRAKGAVSA